MKARAIMAIALFLAAMAAIPAFSANGAAPSRAYLRYLGDDARLDQTVQSALEIEGDNGLDGICATIQICLDSIGDKATTPEQRDFALALMWVASVQGAMLQQIDPMPDPANEKIIEEGMNTAGDELRIPDAERCILRTVAAINKAMKMK